MKFKAAMGERFSRSDHSFVRSSQAQRLLTQDRKNTKPTMDYLQQPISVSQRQHCMA